MDSARQRLVAALVRIVAERGLDAVSVRQVAAAAEVSIGTVQHYFPTKQAMLLAAAGAVIDTFRVRARAAIADLAPEVELRALLAQLVPLDATRAGEGKVWLAFVARAAVDVEVAALHRTVWQELEDRLAALFAAIGDRQAATEQDRANAGLLLATLDGLAIGGLTEPGRLPANRIAELLDAQLEALLKH